jgi:hypothetical protein
MTKTSDLFPALVATDVYTPVRMKFDGVNDKFENLSVNVTGNKCCVVARFRIAEYADATSRQLCFVWAGSQERPGLSFYASNHATTDYRNKCQIYVDNSGGTTVCRLVSKNEVCDNEVHTLFFQYDGDAGTAELIIDGQDADDTGNAQRVAPVTATLSTSVSADVLVGEGWGGSEFWPGEIGFFGLHNTAGLDWTDFMEADGTPKKIDETSWAEWGSQPLAWNEHGDMPNNKGSAGNFARSSSPVITDESVILAGVQPGSMDPYSYTIVNPGAESGDYTTGWTLGTGGWLRRNDFSTAYEGSWYWAVGNYSGGSIYQDITAVAGDVTRAAIDAGQILILGSCWCASYIAEDQCRITIDFYDGTPGTLISTLDTGYFAAHGDGVSNTWIESKLSGVMPANTVTMRLTLWGQRQNGTYCNNHMDMPSITAYKI